MVRKINVHNDLNLQQIMAVLPGVVATPLKDVEADRSRDKQVGEGKSIFGVGVGSPYMNQIMEQVLSLLCFSLMMATH